MGVYNLLLNGGWRSRLFSAFQRLDSLLTASKSSYLLSSGFSVADVIAATCLASLPQLIHFRAFELPQLPNVDKYRTYEHCAEVGFAAEN